MKPHLEISKQLQDLYGNNRIVIGKADGQIYFDLPDDPEVFAHLIKRMFQALAVRDMDDHIEALFAAVDELFQADEDAEPVKVNMGKTVNDADFNLCSHICDTDAFRRYVKMMMEGEAKGGES